VSASTEVEARVAGVNPLRMFATWIGQIFIKRGFKLI